MHIGIIGLGDVGKFCARAFVKQGYRVCGCDLPEKRYQLERDMDGTGVHILDDGNAVAKVSDLTIYAVPAEEIGSVVEQYGPSARKGTIVSGQTSVKTPEIDAFDRYLPNGVSVVPTHFLFKPTAVLLTDKEKMRRKKTAVINHRSDDIAYREVLEAFGGLGSNIVEIPDHITHDKIMADTQAVTHVGYESMGTAWKNAGTYPWESPHYKGGIDNVKILMCLRVLLGKSHVYGGLAILNPFAMEQVAQYARSVSELFELAGRDESAFRERVERNRDFILKKGGTRALLRDDMIEGNGLANQTVHMKPNTHLNPMAMADAWCVLNINPYENLACGTDPYTLRLGVVDYLYRHGGLLEESVHTALHDNGIRGDDTAFCDAVSEWASIILDRDMERYKALFDKTKAFFADRLEEGFRESEKLIERLAA
ncbi:MAG: prephenate dehydrogenase [Candidatus Aenigmarchaeota archaeon]|nr:prephenate dehydrogenase [Candidatus Aenigmarchaeota archaeon]